MNTWQKPRLVPDPPSSADDSTPYATEAEDARQLSDDKLMLLAAAGQRHHFGTLVRRHECAVGRLCALLVRDDPQTASDLTQETFLRLWQSRQTFRPKGVLRPYLFTIARNLCRSELRKRRIRRLLWLETYQEADPDSQIVPTGEEMASEAQRSALVRLAMGRLPEKFRVPLILRFRDDLPYDEIAAAIGRNPGTARSRVHYGLKALAGLLPPELLS